MKVPGKNTDRNIVIVGASLTGLTFALACAKFRIQTLVLERGYNIQQHGSALGIDHPLLLRVTGCSYDSVPPFPVVTEDRKAVAWTGLHTWLRVQASQRQEITLRSGCTAVHIEQNLSEAAVVTSVGERIAAAIIVGADGYRSVVRAAVNPLAPHARYAGYLLWRGLVCEQDLPPDKWAPRQNQGVALASSTGHRLVAYPVTGIDGSLEPGKRWISFAWYDQDRTNLLQDARCLTSDGYVLASLRGQSVPDQVWPDLTDLARQLWPQPWSAVIIHALERRQVFATPVAEYFPNRLCWGRSAVIGDAAHAVSPATGQGFTAGILDAEALAGCLASSLRAREDLAAALRTYEEKRLAAAQALVIQSEGWSRAFLKGIRDS